MASKGAMAASTLFEIARGVRPSGWREVNHVLVGTLASGIRANGNCLKWSDLTGNRQLSELQRSCGCRHHAHVTQLSARAALRPDIVELLNKRGATADHPIVFRWVRQSVPEPVGNADVPVRIGTVMRSGPKANTECLPAQFHRFFQTALPGLHPYRQRGARSKDGSGSGPSMGPVPSKCHREAIIRLSSGRRLKTCFLRNPSRNSRGVIPNCLLKTRVKTAACENPLANATSRIASSP